MKVTLSQGILWPLKNGSLAATRLAVLFLFVGLLSGGSNAYAENTGGFTGPGPGLVTTEQAKSMRDDADVMMRGNIVQNLGGEEYLFRDATGTITVEIDNEVWAGQTIAPADQVEIYGEIDKEWASTKVEVDRIVKK